MWAEDFAPARHRLGKAHVAAAEVLGGFPGLDPACGESRREGAGDVVRQDVSRRHRLRLPFGHRGERRIEPDGSEPLAGAIDVERRRSGGRVEADGGDGLGRKTMG